MGTLKDIPSTAPIALNYVRSRDPVDTDDISAGYSVGAMWTNSTTQDTFICTASVAGQAVWTEILAQTGGGPPPGGGLLTWAPPGYPNYSGYQQRTISNAATDHIVAEASNIDAVFTFSEVVTKRVWIQGFRNVVIIGGHVNYTSRMSAQGEMFRIYRCGGTAGGGIVHLEGLKIETPVGIGTDCIVLSTGRTLASGTNGAILQVQNCYFKNGYWDGNYHADLLQLWTIGAGWPTGYAGGVGKVRIDRFTGYTVQQGVYFWNLDGALEDVDIRNTNTEGYGAQTGQIGPNKGKRADLYGRQSTATYTNVYTYDTATAQLGITDHFIPNGNGTYYGGAADLTRKAELFSDAQGQYVDWVSTADIIGTVRWGRPPGGDFCPSTKAGNNYVSDGYQ